MAQNVIEVADDVFLGRGTDVNWILLRDGDAVTLIDAGYPGDAGRLEASLRALGRRPEDVRAILLTHAHIDHLGGAAQLARRYGTPVYTDAREAAHVRREHLEQAGPMDLAANLWRPTLWPWLGRVLRVGAAKNARIPSAQPFAASGALDLPGRPVPVPTRGHTSGHTAYHLPDVGAVVTGDELVTGHAVTGHVGPHTLPAFFNSGDPVTALAAIETLDADLVLPGHGDALRRPIAEAVAEARDHARR
ncbi:MAG: MBL fold metallo-hydrolase [Jatrophihabitans sp.]|uniref:MBL fold metallo-hydrolase n=1 Tax=Jatrophihabitans sp. TaxID=1932789 RepID=UPI00390E2D28